MAPLKTRTGVNSTPTHKRPTRPSPYSSAKPTIMKIKSLDSNEKTCKDTMGVYLRIRPTKMDDRRQASLMKIDDQQVRSISPEDSMTQLYSFTHVFDNESQAQIFEKTARPTTEDFILANKDGLIFTYGNTGSGKTYTMEGHKTDPGIIYRTIDFLYNSIGSQQTQRCLVESDGQNWYKIQRQEQLYPTLARAEIPSAIPSVVKWQNRTKEAGAVCVDPNVYYCLFISLIELYQKQVHDLFEDFDTKLEKRRKGPEIREDRDRAMCYVANAVEIEVKSADEAVEYYRRGIKRRRTGATALNSESSRGHCVLNLKLVQVSKSYDDQFDESTLQSSQLSLVDLAGSERAKRTEATGLALNEAGKINNSLGALRRCIRALRDKEPTANIRYRDDTLTRLFQSYFEGRGRVSMILCVNPTPEDHHENNIAMQFGLLTQEVAVDFASPPKMLKRSKTGRALDPNMDFANMYEYLDRKMSCYEPNPEISDEQFIDNWITKLKSNRDKRKKYIETAFGAQKEVRQSIVKTTAENSSLKNQYESRTREMRGRDEHIKMLEGQLGATEQNRAGENDKLKGLEKTVKLLQKENNDKNRQIQRLQTKEDQLAREITISQEQNDNLWRGVLELLRNEKGRSDSRKRAMQLLTKMGYRDFEHAEPSAPSEIGPLQSSSPVNIDNPSTSETTESHTQLTTSNSSSEAIDYQEREPRSRMKCPTMARTNSGVPVMNPRHNRSYSCPSGKVLMHIPRGTIDTGTVLNVRVRNGRRVKNLRSSDVLRKDAAGYSVVHQDADLNGDVETSIYKGKIISTVCGGAQVILDDVETMRQVSPKRKKSIRDSVLT